MESVGDAAMASRLDACVVPTQATRMEYAISSAARADTSRGANETLPDRPKGTPWPDSVVLPRTAPADVRCSVSG
jgi:hypothetical protein